MSSIPILLNPIFLLVITFIIFCISIYMYFNNKFEHPNLKFIFVLCAFILLGLVISRLIVLLIIIDREKYIQTLVQKKVEVKDLIAKNISDIKTKEYLAIFINVFLGLLFLWLIVYFRKKNKYSV